MNIKDIIRALPPMDVGDDVYEFHCKEGHGNDRLSIKRTERGWIYHCFHCGDAGGVLMDKSTTGSTAPRNEDSTTGVRSNHNSNRPRTWTLPADATATWSDFSVHARSWLRQYITVDEVRDNGILYSDRLSRVLFPVRSTTNLIGYQTSRLLSTDNKPKYLTYVNDRENFYLVLSCSSGVSTSVVVVEDFLSAVVCSRYCDSAALMGTSMKDTLLARLAGRYDKYLIFLDDDNDQVRAAQRKIQRRLQCFGNAVILSGTGKDPKDCDDVTLRGLLL
jgi:hypothetical protein